MHSIVCGQELCSSRHHRVDRRPGCESREKGDTRCAIERASQRLMSACRIRDRTSKYWDQRVVGTRDRRERQARDAQDDDDDCGDRDIRCCWCGLLADSKARCRAVRRQRLRDDLGLAHSGLRRQSVLARSLELDRSAARAGKMLPGSADEFGAARGFAAAAVRARHPRLDASAATPTTQHVRRRLESAERPNNEFPRTEAHLIQIRAVVELTFYP